MPSTLEILANLVTLVSVLLASRNHVLTWPLGIIGCLLFGWLFFEARLYADVTLQVFFIATSASGWWYWLHGRQGEQAPIQNAHVRGLLWRVGVAVGVAFAYGGLLHHWTDAYAPFIDSLVLTFSVLAQLLLMQRKLETWYGWLLVNTLSVPLYLSRELYLTAGVYTLFWFNAWYGWWCWRRLLRNGA